MSKKLLVIAASTAFFTMGITTAFAHQAYIAPLGHHVEGDHVIVHAGYTEDLFVAEFPLKATFSMVDPKGLSSSLTDINVLKSATIVEAKLAEKGTYKIVANNERETKFAQVNGIWQSVRDVPVAEAPAADKRKYVLASEVGNNKTATAKHISQVLTYVTKDDASNGALTLSNQGLELKFEVNPTQIKAKDGLIFDVLLNGKPVEGVAFEVHQAGEEHTDQDAEKPEQSYNSNKAGRVSIPLVNPGAYLITTTYPKVKSGDIPAAIVYQYALSIAAE